MLRYVLTIAAVAVACWGLSTLILAATAVSRDRKRARRLRSPRRPTSGTGPFDV